MTHEDQQCLELGRMVVEMIRDVLSTPKKDEALTSRTITTRDGGRVQLAICKEEETIAELESILAKRMDMVQLHLKRPGARREN